MAFGNQRPRTKNFCLLNFCKCCFWRGPRGHKLRVHTLGAWAVATVLALGVIHTFQRDLCLCPSSLDIITVVRSVKAHPPPTHAHTRARTHTLTPTHTHRTTTHVQMHKQSHTHTTFPSHAEHTDTVKNTSGSLSGQTRDAVVTANTINTKKEKVKMK